MKVYKIYSLDVWGNNKDGYEVNDLCFSGLTIELPENFTDKQLIKAMKEVGFINTKCQFKSFDIVNSIETLYIDYSTSKIHGRPIAELRLVDEKPTENDALKPFFVNV